MSYENHDEIVKAIRKGRWDMNSMVAFSCATKPPK